MPEDADAAEFTRLDEVIAESDARGGSSDRWQAAQAVYEKAQLVERLGGADAAVPLYVDVVERLADSKEPGPLEWRICAMNDLVVIHHDHGREGESRSAARALFEEHFDDAPPDATDALVEGVRMLAKLLRAAGEYDEALDVADRLLDR